MPHAPPFHEFLDTNGDGTGIRNAIGDFSSSPVDFFYTRPAGSDGNLFLNSFVIHLQSPVKVSASGYGDSMNPLPNGISLFIRDKAAVTVRDFTPGIPVKTNSDWSRYGGRTSIEPYSGGDYFFKATFRAVSPDEPILLPPEHSMGLTLNDDFSGLISQTFFLGGIFE